MALCGFRADNYPLGLLEGEDLHRILSLLEKLADGGTVEDIEERDSVLLDALKRSGFVSSPEEGMRLSSEGEQFLETCRALIRSASTHNK